MIADLKPYPVYKPSGFKWLGAIPEGWEVRRLGSITTPVSRRRRSDLPLLSVLREKGVIHREEGDGNHNVIPEDLTNYKVVEPGDLVINKMKAWQGSLGVAAMDGIVSPAYFVYRLRMAERRYAHVLLRSRPYIGAFATISNGVRVDQWDLSPVGMKAIPTLVPSRGEQAAIVRFLDHVDSRIQRLIAAKERLIELLEEEKQAIIHRAVTRGLDPDVPLKPSGADWLGDAPEHWELVPNRALLRSEKRVVGEQSAEYVLLSLTKQGIVARDMENPEGKFPASFDTYQVVEPGDLVFCLFDIDETPRAVGLSKQKGMITGAYTRFICREPRDAEFVYLYYLAMDNGKRLKPLYTGLRKVITRERFLAARMPVPPVNERREIVGYVHTVSQKIESAILKLRREIRLAREFRTRLISDVVTGKLDVRETATRFLDADDIALDERLEEVATA